MSETAIPEDIMEAARSAFRKACSYPKNAKLVDGGLVTTIAEAILAERRAEHERCNEIIRAAWGQKFSLEAFEAVTKADGIVASHS